NFSLPETFFTSFSPPPARCVLLFAASLCSGEANYSKAFPIRAILFEKLFKLFIQPLRKPAPALDLQP
ncbi:MULTISPECIES: hypothetical protein, partial [unclassified Herbaspirillum]|uniref:hypothetical protein n=1 Tax=unclassified Herbaspirillum TaxID=2624150 RepID=UPI001ADBA870